MVIKKDEALKNRYLPDILDRDSVCIIPCDTIYGFIGITSTSESKIQEIKGRKEDHPFLRLVHSKEMLQMLTDARIDDEILSFWPGPLTVVVPFRGGGTIGVRVPDDTFLIRLLEIIEKPLISTSVNRSGQKPMNKIDDIVNHFEESVACIVDGGDMEGKTPSTVLDISVKPYRILRIGACTIPPRLLE